jgi:DHA1 family inner membrane transport protein
MTESLALAAPRAASPNVAVLALALGAFAVGTSEFMISGLLGEVAADLDVPIPSAGLLITGYAGGVAVGGPLMAIATGWMDRKRQILLLLAVFVAGNLICALAPSYALLLLGRIVGAFCHGAFHGAASVVAGRLVPEGRRARAIALVTAGVMVANIIGVPLGTALGQLVDWRAAFWAVSILGALAALTLATLLPTDVGRGSGRLLTEARALLRPQVLHGLGLSFCFTVGLFCLFTYISPLLMEVSRAEAGSIPLLLVLFGAGATVGVLAGGRLADWNMRAAIAIAFSAQVVTYLAVAVFCTDLPAMVGLLFLLGVTGMLAVAPLKTLVLNGALDAPGLAATMTSSTLNLGVAVGAAVGSALLAAGAGYAALPGVGVACAAVGLGVVWLKRH